MQVVSIHIDTIFDEAAAERCHDRPGSTNTPFPLHELACVSTFSVTHTAEGDTLYALESFSRRTMSVRAIIASVEEAIGHAHSVLSFGGGCFILPVLITRAAVHEVHVPRLLDLGSRSAASHHFDARGEAGRYEGSTILAQLCAPFSIPVSQTPAAMVTELVATNDWLPLEQHCETNAVAIWLASQFWTGVQTPGLARARWRDFAGWVEANAGEHPHLAPFATVGARPAPSVGSSAFGDDDV